MGALLSALTSMLNRIIVWVALATFFCGCAVNEQPPVQHELFASSEQVGTNQTLLSQHSPADSVLPTQHVTGSAAKSVSEREPALPKTAYSPRLEEYRIGSQDLLEIQVLGANELNRTLRVNTSGYVSVPLIGMVKASGLTAEQLEQRLADELGKDYLQNPQVSVFIKEYTSQRVTVEGAVKKPGIYPLTGQTSLLQVLAAAEGLTNVANPNNIQLFRTEPDGTKRALVFDLEQIRLGQVENPIVKNEDIIQVRESKGKSLAKDIIEFILPFRYFYYYY
jgi:polysaccharide export outer membrane protein